MRKILNVYTVPTVSLMLIATPASALDLGDLAKVVLGNSSVLKKGEEKCGSSFGFTKSDSLAMTAARSATEQALPISQFLTLDKASQVDATTAAANPNFCNETKKKKSGLMKAMTKAGKSILKQKALGGLGL
jgi:antitoxin component of RelBE/YafQ-DinJ toxin-antitoxin module